MASPDARSQMQNFGAISPRRITSSTKPRSSSISSVAAWVVAARGASSMRSPASKTRTGTPCRANASAAMAPTGPPPAMRIGRDVDMGVSVAGAGDGFRFAHPTCYVRFGTRSARGESEMKAAVLGDAGVEVRDIEKPAPKPNEVLLRVRASTLNRADLIVASGHRHGAVGGAGARIGLECAGEVEAVGGDVTGVKPGDRVMATAPGGIAEYAVTDFVRVHRIPANN